ncbi:MAG: DHHA1 domain-containing protein [Chloroflexota bacterium]
MTERLFFEDAYCRAFSAVVTGRTRVGKSPGVILDRTAFYPTSGGQPGDLGALNGVPVLDVVEGEGGEIIHLLAGEIEGSSVAGAIDWPRRFDHMQQHSGQHILSQCFERALNAATVSFHLGLDFSTIDVALAAFTEEQATDIETMANAVVFENRAIRAYFVDEAQLPSLPLRKPPKVAGAIRIVEVEGFDFSACGGTHCRAAGEIGLIKVRRWERRGDTFRIDFLCGNRALGDYRWKNSTLNNLAVALSVKDREVGETVCRLLAEGREAQQQLSHLKEKLLDYEAAELDSQAQPLGGMRVVRRAFTQRSSDELRRLALRLTARPGRIALLGLAGEKAQLVFARSFDASLDMVELLKGSCAMLEGRGGGTPSLAQGGGTRVDRLEAALDLAQAALARALGIQR